MAKEPWSITPLWLLTHTETHEFHHKGQIVSVARHLGYTLLIQILILINSIVQTNELL